MTKKDIVRVISEELGLTQQDTKEVVQRTFDSIVDALVRDGRIELRNFGVFEVKPRAARTARNPKTGQSVEVPAKFVVTFKPGKVMEQRVGELNVEDTVKLWDASSSASVSATPPARTPQTQPPQTQPARNQPNRKPSPLNQSGPQRPIGLWGGQ